MIALLASCASVRPPIPLVPTDTGSGDSASDTGFVPTVDTGPYAPCPLEVHSRMVWSCVESTGERGDGDSGTANDAEEAWGTGLVTEVGGVLERPDGSVPFAEFAPCGPDETEQVRLVDGEGVTWTFGWALEGEGDSLASISPGMELAFYVVYTRDPIDQQAAVLLSDSVGPLFLYEISPRLTEAQRGGVAVEVDSQTSCVVEEMGYAEQHYLVRFTWSGGVAELWSGASSTVSLPDRDLELVVVGSSYALDCLDGCGSSAWAAWAEEP